MLWSVPPFMVCMIMIGLTNGWIPPGVPGEWTWTAPNNKLSDREWLFAGASITGYLLYLLTMMRFVNGSRFHGLAVISLFPAALILQIGLHLSAPYGFGLAKWPICSFSPGCSGYFLIAKTEAVELPEFLVKYPEWIKSKDSLHIGTHPPGLIASSWAWLHFWESHPNSARFFISNLPAEMRDGARNVLMKGTLSPSDQATLVSIGMTYWFLGALSVWPLYLLVRKLGGSPAIAFQISSFWPVIPSATMFQPASDIAFAPLVTLSVALAYNCRQSRISTFQLIGLILSGVILGIGMFFSLVFLPAGLIIALLILSTPQVPIRTKIQQILAIGVGFLAITIFWGYVTGSNPLRIWYFNQINHGRFYIEFPRTYWKWLLADLGETAIGLSFPIFFLVLISLISQIRTERKQALTSPAVITALVLIALAISGKSLSEVGRLWLPFYPLLISSIVKMKHEPKPIPLHLWYICWSIIQLIWLQAIVQVVYPI
jgi:hypothetical protein